MEIQIVLTVILAVAVGVSLGLLGGGGSILTVPLLAYVAGLEPKQAISGSLFVVGVTSLIGVIAHARAGHVRWRAGIIFGVTGMVGAFLGGLAGGHIPGTVLMMAFATVMIVTATAMIRGRREPQRSTATAASTRLPVTQVVLQGLVVGAVSGLVGAGGGFLIVPALALLGGLAMPVAVGTSLLVMSMQTFAGLAGYLTVVTMNWMIVSAVAGAAIVGSLFGTRLNSRIPEHTLRRGFGVFVLVMGGLVLAQELPSPANWIVMVLAIVAAVVAAVTGLVRTRSRT